MNLRSSMMLLRCKLLRRALLYLVCFIAGIFAVKIINSPRNLTLRCAQWTALLESSVLGLQKTDHTRNYGSRANYSILDVDSLVKIFQSRYNSSTNNDLVLRSEESYSHFLQRLNSRRKKGAMLIKEAKEEAKNSAERFHRGVNQFYLYDPNDERVIEDLLMDLSSLPIVSTDVPDSGNQFKIKLTFSDGSQGFFKPMRKPREIEASPDDYIFYDSERHVGEIAAFHVDRVMGFNRIPPVVGRKLNMSQDLTTFFANKNYVDFLYTSPAGNLCFVATCYQYCGPHYPFCGRETFLEGSIAASLPPHRVFFAHPYRRAASTNAKADWELDESYCEKRVKTSTSLFRLLEFVDLSVFDFLIGNMDRHTYEMFRAFGNNSSIVMYDNGRAFGRSNYDCMSCIAPLRQCCLIRLSTLAKLIKLYQGPDSLSQVLRKSLNSDPLTPVLLEPHLDAVDRRLGKVIKVVSDCINNGRSWDKVVVDDRITQ